MNIQALSIAPEIDMTVDVGQMGGVYNSLMAIAVSAMMGGKHHLASKVKKSINEINIVIIKVISS